jgi:leucyl aminopeptidase
MQLLPGDAGALAGVLFGVDEANAPARDPFGPGKLATSLPEGVYRFADPPEGADLAALGFLLGLYRYDRFKANTAPAPQLIAPEAVDAIRIQRIAEAIAFGRDLVNAPANALGPDALEQEVVKLAEHFDASVAMVRGEELIAANFPLVHAVGRAGAEEPRIVDFAWGREDAPKVAIVGKGVTFDTGGLDIKPASGMELMKKDMGGAATALTLARLIMEAGLDLRLRTVIPIVENAIAAPAMRPGDVIVSRKGISVEVGNTDAEGRMILADALALADEDAPELMLDFATLTGAARVALGPDLPPFYTDDDALAGQIADHAVRTRDPVWRMPLWRPYDAMIEGSVADVSNSGSGAGMAGSITAALFLRRFVEKARSWAHFDVYAWNPKPRAHGPAGGEIQAARGLFELLSERYPRR